MLFLEYVKQLLKLEKESDLLDPSFDHEGFPLFLVILDFATAQLNGWKMAIAYVLGIRKNDPHLMELIKTSNSDRELLR